MSRNPIFRIVITEDSHKAILRAKGAVAVPKLIEGLTTLLESAGKKAADYIRENFLSGQILNQRTGELARGLEGRVLVRRDAFPAARVGVFTGPAVRYAGVLEMGTRDLNPDSPYPVIRPRNAKALAFAPEGSPALDGRGVAMYDSPRDYPTSLSFIPFRGGRIAIGALYDTDELKAARRSGALDLRKLQAVYVLLRQMSVKPRHYMERGLIQYLPFFVTELTLFLRSFVNVHRSATNARRTR